jgi:hypothetical protein
LSQNPKEVPCRASSTVTSRHGASSCRAEFHEQRIACEAHRAQFVQPRPQPFQLPPAYRALLGDPIAALGEHVELVVLREQLHLHAGTGSVPRLVEQRLLQAGEPPLRRADQVVHRRIGGAHLRQHLFGRDASIHAPHASRFAILALDAGEEILERRAVAGIAREHLVGERKTLRAHHQRNHHLHTIRTMVARVAMAALVLLVGRRIRFEIRARQVIQEHIETHVEQIAPATDQMIEQRFFVL